MAAATRADLDAFIAGLPPRERRRDDAAPMPDSPTLRRILVAVDGSRAALDAEETAARLATAFDSDLLLAHVTSTQAGDSPETLSAFHLEDALVRHEASGSARPPGRVRGLLLEGDPGLALAEAAKREEADLVVVGSHGKGMLQRVVLGSTSDAVKNHAPCSVLIVRSTPAMERILVAVDGSPPSRRAAAWGLAFARGFRSELVLAHVRTVAGYAGGAVVRASEDAEAVEESFAFDSVEGVPVRFAGLADVAAAEAVARFATQERCDPLLVGTHGLGFTRRVLVGSVADRLAKEATSSVLIVR